MKHGWERPGLWRWLVSAIMVLAVHAVVVGLLIGRWRMQPPPPQDMPMQAVMVDMAAKPVARMVPPQAVAPGPSQRRLPRPEVRPHVAKIRLKPTPLQVHPPVALPPQSPMPRSPVVPPQTTSPPQVDTARAEQTAAQQTVAATGQAAIVDWQGLLLGHLQKYRRYPWQAELNRQQGIVYVRFSVDRHGQTSALALVRSSGSSLLDEAALDTVRRASPVPPPPAQVKADPVQVMVPVSFFLRH